VRLAALHAPQAFSRMRRQARWILSALRSVEAQAFARGRWSDPDGRPDAPAYGPVSFSQKAIRGDLVRKSKMGAVLWMFCLQYFVAEAVSIHGWVGSYSLSRNYISDLGAIGCSARATNAIGTAEDFCSRLHAVMNASFLLQGMLIVCGAALIWPLFPKGGLWMIGLSLVGASGVGVFLVGLAPEDSVPSLHFLGAIENFICCNAGMAIVGVALLLWRPEARGAGLFTLGVGTLGLSALGCLAMGVYLGLGVGGMERVVAYPFPLWLAGVGYLLLRKGALANLWIKSDRNA
jgi:hypothetical membrane protein